MVDFIKRDKNDLYGKPILGFLFKNQKFLMILKLVVLALFFYAIYYGYAHTGKDNNFTWAVFWGIFWSLFMVVTLPTLGRVFCGICPHGFMGKYITKFGLKKKMPKWLQNPYIGLFLIVIGWWGIYYMFPGIYRTPLGTAILFTVMTLLSFVVYFIYRDMAYCKYICPIGTLTRAYAKLSFTWLGTYKSACDECKTFDCAVACQHNLKPFTFDGRNSMTDCTLCMDCSAACEAVSFKVKKPSFSLFSKFQILKAEVWTFILILASIPITMAFHHGIGRSTVAGDMIWAKTAEYFKTFVDFGSINPVGLFAFLYAMLFTVSAALIGMYIASLILKTPFKKVFYSLGYSYAPLFILGSIAHSLETFFVRGYERIVEGFAQAFGLSVDIASLASRGDSWLHMFGILKWVAIIWALIILYKRMKLLDADKMRKIIAYPFAASLIIFFLSVNMYRSHILDTYGRASGGHGSHGGGAMFQSVSKDKATLLQADDSCVGCGMNLPKFYKTNHAAHLDKQTRQYCSIHCLSEEKSIKKIPLNDLKVVDVTSLKFIDATSAFYVVGSKKKATMSEVSKYAFALKEEAVKFSQRYGGKVLSFEEAYKIALNDFNKKGISKIVKPEDSIYFVRNKPALDSKKNHRGGHMMGSRDRTQIPTRKVWLVSDEINDPKCVQNVEGHFFATDVQNKPLDVKIQKRECTGISFELRDVGYYKLYYVDEKSKNINIAKYEYKRYDHSSDEEYNKEKMSAKTIKEVPFDILRLRPDDETFYSRLQSGDRVKFKVVKNRKPVEGAKVSLETQFGWQKNIYSDKDGIAEFQLIRDYNPPWDKFDKRFRENFLVTATYNDDNKSYKISFMESFRPSRDDYQSYSYGLIITLVLLVLFSGAIFLYRYRVQKPFKEVKFDE